MLKDSAAQRALFHIDLIPVAMALISTTGVASVSTYDYHGFISCQFVGLSSWLGVMWSSFSVEIFFDLVEIWLHG